MDTIQISENKKENRSVACIVALLLCCIYGSFLLHPITLVTADLGRHVKNGEFVFHRADAFSVDRAASVLSRSLTHSLRSGFARENPTGFLVAPSSADISPVGRNISVLHRNFYSYTEPDFPVVNHHWASGALFYALWKQFGWMGVHVFFIALSIAAFLIFYSLAAERAGTGVAALAAIAIIPLLAERTEIRPEAISYLLSGIFLWVLLRYRESKLSFRAAAIILGVLEILWVNTHIYFFLGPLLVGAFLVESLVKRSFRGSTAFNWAALAGCASIGALVNPFGVHAVTYPFTILQRYGYRLAENQPVWFMEKLMHDPNFTIFKLVFWIGAIGLAALPFMAYGGLAYMKRSSGNRGDHAIVYPHRNIASLLLFAGIGAMAWLQIRNFTLFGFFALPLLAGALTNVFQEIWAKYRRELAAVSLAIVTLVSFIAFSGDVQKAFPHWRQFGFGLEAGDSAAADFFKRERLAGPILNNYDIGGYLIFHLFPRERVFVDNRPEAYSVPFFQDTYIPLQESEEAWKRALERYKFNVIFFSHRDATPWGQRFLIQRVQDREWVPVFADKQVIIFLRNTEANSAVIEKYAIPRENFSVTSS